MIVVVIVVGLLSKLCYHVPADWLLPNGNNLVVLFEEMGVCVCVCVCGIEP